MFRTVVIEYRELRLICSGFYDLEVKTFHFHTITYNEINILPVLEAFEFDCCQLENLCLEKLQ